MWRKKLHAILVHYKCARALSRKEALSKEISTFNKAEVLETTYSLLILYLLDNMFRQIDEENTAVKVWLKLESLYMTKSLTNKIYFKEQLFGFNMDPTI